jgi:hypothetical protein
MSRGDLSTGNLQNRGQSRDHAVVIQQIAPTAAIAHDLGRDLYRVDLAAVMSKYIAETEKNLKRAEKRKIDCVIDL